MNLSNHVLIPVYTSLFVAHRDAEEYNRCSDLVRPKANKSVDEQRENPGKALLVPVQRLMSIGR